MPRRPMTEAEKQNLREVWARKKAAISQVKADGAVEKTHTDRASAELRNVHALIEGAKDTLAKQLRANDSVERSHKARIEELTSLTEEAEEALRQVYAELKSAKAEQSERSAYREQQEKEISEVVEKGNDRLYEVDQEVKELLRKLDTERQQIAELTQQKVVLEQDKKDLELNCGVVEARLNELKLRYDQAAEKYRTDLAVTRATIAEDQEAIIELKAVAKHITDELVLKNKALSSRENALVARDAELTSRERLLKSRESRYS